MKPSTRPPNRQRPKVKFQGHADRALLPVLKRAAKASGLKLGQYIGVTLEMHAKTQLGWAPRNV